MFSKFYCPFFSSLAYKKLEVSLSLTQTSKKLNKLKKKKNFSQICLGNWDHRENYQTKAKETGKIQSHLGHKKSRSWIPKNKYQDGKTSSLQDEWLEAQYWQVCEFLGKLCWGDYHPFQSLLSRSTVRFSQWRPGKNLFLLPVRSLEIIN